ncbi:hypothetical protein HJG60_008914 [Phyllostomus discolor]|uniref:Uncharacterized protein n=1 Tax=Phyllostomus discolor TaxID=89673 RepID=A0A834DLA6_9CHIR|nr:hypothetical protein HJG60_008914 [Phyllostomus discolor]
MTGEVRGGWLSAESQRCRKDAVRFGCAFSSAAGRFQSLPSCAQKDGRYSCFSSRLIHSAWLGPFSQWCESPRERRKERSSQKAAGPWLRMENSLMHQAPGTETEPPHQRRSPRTSPGSHAEAANILGFRALLGNIPAWDFGKHRGDSPAAKPSL